MAETDFIIANKLWRYKFDRSSKVLQINIVIGPDKKIRIILCFSSENYSFAFKTCGLEDLLEDDPSPYGWYLVTRYDIIEVEVPFFKHNNIAEFVLFWK